MDEEDQNQQKNLFANLIDNCVDGKLTFDDMSMIYTDIKNKNSITGWYAKNAFHDLATLRYRFTLEMMVSTIIYLLSKPRSTTKKAIDNFEKAYDLLGFIINETKTLQKREAKRRKKKGPSEDTTGENDGTVS
jgi:hypothetical protein